MLSLTLIIVSSSTESAFTFSEKTLSIQGDTFEVIGKSYVLVYDGTFWHAESETFKKARPGERVFHFMKSGQKYHMRNRYRID